MPDGPSTITSTTFAVVDPTIRPDLHPSISIFLRTHSEANLVLCVGIKFLPAK